MLILAFESSGRAASVALMRDEKIISENFRCDGVTHSETLLPMAEKLLDDCGVSIKDIDIFAVANGPGSFTGIRIGVSTVKGLSWALDKPCVGVSTPESMAYLCTQYDGRLICPVQDARRNQVYNALFRIEDGRAVRIRDDRAISLDILTEDLLSFDENVIILGDGTEVTKAALDKTNVKYTTAPEEILWPHAWGVAKASIGKELLTSQELLPVYLRLSQAERERQEKLNL